VLAVDALHRGGNPLAWTILVECAWAALRYNPWAKGVYERICGKQKTRKKKAGIALARKIAVIAWVMLRDEKDWEPKRMIEVTESDGRMSTKLKETLQNMKPKENADQRKSRLRKEARATKANAERRTVKTDGKPSSSAALLAALQLRATRTTSIGCQMSLTST
jgi:transposase